MRLKVLVSAGLVIALSVVSIVAFVSSLDIEKKNRQREQEKQQVVIEENNYSLVVNDNLEILFQSKEHIYYETKIIK